MLEILKAPWPWYVSGPLIGLMVPAMLVLSNKKFGVSSSFRHICAACFPGKIPYFSYGWKKEAWNLFFVAGILLGAVIASQFLQNPDKMLVDARLENYLAAHGVQIDKELVPVQIFNWSQLLTLKGFIIIILGGFMVGFGTRYAGGCTSGHSIMGLSNLQLSSLIATISFMAGGFLMTNLILPYILKL